MNKIIYDIEVNPKQEKEDLWNYYYQYTKQIKNKKQLVKLCLYCAKYCFEYNDEELKPHSQKCIELVEKYLIDPNSVTQQDLRNAAYAAYDASYSAANASYYASAYAAAAYAASCLYHCSQIPNINMNLPHQYLQILLRSTKQFNIQNHYSKTIEPIQQNKITWDYYYKYIKQIKNRKDLIKLGLYCTKYCFEYNNEETKPLAQKCIDLVEKYLIDPNSVKQQDLDTAASYAYATAYASSATAAYAYATAYASSWGLYYCSLIQNMNLPNQYLQILFRTTKQFNTNNPYSQTIEQISKQDIDKLELVDYNMLLDISNEHYNIDLSEFNYENIFSRRNLIEMIRGEYDCTIGVAK